MPFRPFEINVPHIAYTVLGGFVVLFGMFSLFLREKLYVGEACWAFIFGIIVGPYCAGIFDPHDWAGGDEDVVNQVTLEFTRVVLAVGVFAIGVELPKAYMARHWKSLAFLLGPIMTWGWFVSAGLIYALVPGLNFLSSLVIAACLTPTDPILAAAVVGGKYADKHVPAHIRHLLAAESGCNDGAAFPFLYIGLYLIIDRPSTGRAVKDWFLTLWLYQVILGIVIGALIGIAFRYLMKFCESKNLIDRHSYVAQYISLALLATGATALLGSDDLLSAFACGAAFAWDGFFNRQTEESVFSSVIDLLFNIAAFVYVGAWMPFGDFDAPELTLSVWRLIVIAILVLLLRRLPVMLALYKWIPDIKTFREAIFSGHFGPMGIGAIFISTLAVEVLHRNIKEPDHQTELLMDSMQPIVAFMVLCSILVHGLSIPSFSLGRRVHSVSRTWSRHAGAPDVPDWTNQARIVDKREDIVINRDEDLAEKGDLTPEERTEVGSSPAGSSSPLRRERELERETIEDAARKGTLNIPAGEEPADGSEIISEWQEGPHRIIERRSGPGEEVEVEVLRNFHGDEPDSHRIRGSSRAAAHAQVHAYMNKLKMLPHALEEDLHMVERELEKDITELKDKTHASPSSSPDSVNDDNEDEEGWTSDPDTGTSQPTRTKSRSRNPKVKSKRRGVKPAKPEARGRRVDELRRSSGFEGRSEEVSPTRSVRFRDEGSRHASGSNTPRLSMVDSPEAGRVTFDLPTVKGEGAK